MSQSEASEPSFATLCFQPYLASWQTKISLGPADERLVARHIVLKARLDWERCGATLGEDDHVMEGSIDFQCVSPQLEQDERRRTNRCSVFERDEESHWAAWREGCILSLGFYLEPQEFDALYSLISRRILPALVEATVRHRKVLEAPDHEILKFSQGGESCSVLGIAWFYDEGGSKSASGSQR
jgi:hypothetical protein